MNPGLQKLGDFQDEMSFISSLSFLLILGKIRVLRR